MGSSGSRDRFVELDGAFNVRDLGGLAIGDDLRVKSGLLYRGDALSSLSDNDRFVLFDRLKIQTVIDLRTAEEAGGDGGEDARLFPLLDAYHFTVIPEGRIGREPFPSADPTALARRYVENLLDGTSALVGALRAIEDSVSDGRPVLFHCAAGRDRTGMLAAVLLDLLGVRRDEIAADYVESNRNAHEVTRRLRRSPLYVNDNGADHPVVMLRSATIERFLSLVDSELNGVRGWAQFAGLSAEVVGRLEAELVIADPN